MTTNNTGMQNVTLQPPYPPNVSTEQILQQRAVQFANQGSQLASQGNYSEAIRLLDEAMYNYPRLENLQYFWALCLWKLGRSEEARVAITSEVKSYPGRQYSSALFISIVSDPDRGLDQKTILRRHEFKVSSQNGEDGILLYIFSKIGTTNRFFVEFGIGNGVECNTANLSRNFGWSGLLMDGNEDGVLYARKYYENRAVKVANCFITTENINQILTENGMTGEIDLLSVDIDGNDYWIWKTINIINPRVVIVEYNASFGPDKSLTIKYNPNFDRHKFPEAKGYYHGASISALKKLGNAKGYMLIGCDSNGCNAFFVRKDVSVGKFNELSPQEAYYPQIYRHEFLSEENQFDLMKHLEFEIIGEVI